MSRNKQNKKATKDLRKLNYLKKRLLDKIDSTHRQSFHILLTNN